MRRKTWSGSLIKRTKSKNLLISVIKIRLDLTSISTYSIRRWKIGHMLDSVPSLIECNRTKIFKECSKVLREESTFKKA